MMKDSTSSRACLMVTAQSSTSSVEEGDHPLAKFHETGNLNLTHHGSNPIRKNGIVHTALPLFYNENGSVCDDDRGMCEGASDTTKSERKVRLDPQFEHLPGWTPDKFLALRARNDSNPQRLLLDYHPKRSSIFRIGGGDNGRGIAHSASFSSCKSLGASSFSSTSSSAILCSSTGSNNEKRRAFQNKCKLFSNSDDSDDRPLPRKSAVLFPSMRLLLAVLLCCCYITISISSSNIAVALICMIKCPIHGYIGDLEWHSDQEGLVLASQNVGSLLILLTGYYADRINGKWMVGSSLLLCFIGNLLLPLMAAKNFWFAVLARLAIGASDACMSPAVNSLITRWFPQTERAAAIGIITGGRQIGTLFILPTAGYLCTRTDIQGGWPAIFYLSGLISGLVFIFWIPMGADKPAKQYCISNAERLFIESRIACESIGKRSAPRNVPWSEMLRSVPLWISVFSLICHEYPLVIMLQFLPNYMRDVLEFAPTKNGFLSALPILFLFISKTASSSVSSWLSAKNRYNSTTICKMFNGVASFGLSISILAVAQFRKETAHLAIISLCFAMAFAGMHTPGVQTALLQLAPPFSGIVTGISFFSVAWFSIGNKILTKWIVQHGDQEEWVVVFYISSAVAALPVVVFSLWGTDQRQWWAAPSSKNSMCSTFSSPASPSNSNSGKEEEK